MASQALPTENPSPVLSIENLSTELSMGDETAQYVILAENICNDVKGLNPEIIENLMKMPIAREVGGVFNELFNTMMTSKVFGQNPRVAELVGGGKRRKYKKGGNGNIQDLWPFLGLIFLYVAFFYVPKRKNEPKIYRKLTAAEKTIKDNYLIDPTQKYSRNLYGGSNTRKYRRNRSARRR
jgi:hypothetical protein